MSLKKFVGKRMTKAVKFMGEDVKIQKLTVDEVFNIQNAAKEQVQSEEDGLRILKIIIKAGVENSSDMEEEDFKQLPMDELSKLSNEIMKFSGINADEKAGK